MNARALNILGLVLVGVIGMAFMILTPRLAELDTVLELTVYLIMAILALSLALIWGYGGILCFGQSAFFRPWRLHLRDRDVQFRRKHASVPACDHSAGGVCGAAWIFHVLRPHRRGLSRRHHADGDLDPVQFRQFHGRAGIPHRRGAARRIQRHSGNSPAQCPRQQEGRDRSGGHVLSRRLLVAG